MMWNGKILALGSLQDCDWPNFVMFRLDWIDSCEQKLGWIVCLYFFLIPFIIHWLRVGWEYWYSHVCLIYMKLQPGETQLSTKDLKSEEDS